MPVFGNTAIMAPGFDQLSDHDFEDDIEDIDFSDLKERYDVRMEEGLDTFVVCLLLDEIIDGLLNKWNRSLMVYLSSTKNRNQNSSNSCSKD